MHLSYKRTLFHNRILLSLFCYLPLSACTQLGTTACCQTVLTHYLMINHLRAAANSLSCHHERQFRGTMADDHIHCQHVAHGRARGKEVVLMGGAINRSFISAYFLTAQTYKHMRLVTRVYGIRYSIATSNVGPPP